MVASLFCFCYFVILLFCYFVICFVIFIFLGSRPGEDKTKTRYLPALNDETGRIHQHSAFGRDDQFRSTE